MPSQHQWPQHSLRIAGPLWDRAKRFAQRTGQTVTAVVTAALGEYLDRNDDEERPGRTGRPKKETTT